MSPTLALSAAHLGQNILSAIVPPPSNPVPRPGEQTSVDFQTFLAKASASPEFQKTSFLLSQGIQSPADAQQKLGDLGAQILQDPKIQMMIAGDSLPVEMRFLPDGSVSIKTSDGRQKTIQLEGESKESVRKATAVADYLQSSRPSGLSAACFSETASSVGIKITPGTGSAMLLP